MYIDKLKGLLIERFSILCHAAIVSREYKIPSAVGVNAELNEGDKVELIAEKNGNAKIIVKN